MKKIVAGPVIVEDGRVLLVKDGSDDYWKFCGGKKEEYETDPTETARREPEEELGMEVVILDTDPFPIEKENFLLLHFLSKRVSTIRGGSAQEWKWILLEELGKENLAPNVIPALRHFGFIE